MNRAWFLHEHTPSPPFPRGAHLTEEKLPGKQRRSRAECGSYRPQCRRASLRSFSATIQFRAEEGMIASNFP